MNFRGSRRKHGQSEANACTLCPSASTRPSQSHQSVSGVGQVRLLVAVVVGRPAVRHQEVQDGWVVGDLGTSPAHHQSTGVDVLHLHVDGGAAAH